MTNEKLPVLFLMGCLLQSQSAKVSRMRNSSPEVQVYALASSKLSVKPQTT